MPRVKGGVRHVQHRKNILSHTKGFMWGRKSKVKIAKIAMIRKYRYAWRDRRLKKRVIRQNWHRNINAALHAQNLKWSTFLPALTKAKITLNRKMLADLCANQPAVFLKLVEKAKPHIAQKKSTPA